MNWFSQVRHVAAKDVRRSRWALIVYIAIITASTVSFVTGRAFGPYPTKLSTDDVPGMPDTFVVYLPMVSVILGLVASASLLQLDSPTRANAFWASRPLSPSAVLGAKLAVVMIAIVGLPLIGVAIGLTALDTSFVDTTKLVARCAVRYGEWALAVLVVGALTKDLRGAALALISILFGATMLLAAFSTGPAKSATLGPGPSEMAVHASLVIFAVVGVIGGIALLAFLYRTRAKRPGTWIAVAIATAWLVLASFATAPSNVRPRVQGGSPASLVLQLQPGDTGAWRHEARALALRLAPSAGFPTIGDRADFRPDSVTIELLDGKRVNVDPMGRTTITLGRPRLGTAVRWLDAADEQSHGFLTVEPKGGTRGAIANNARSVSVAGVVTSLRLRPIASLPLRTGESVIHDGRRIVIYGFSHDTTDAHVWVQLFTVPRDTIPGVADLTRSIDDLRFALVNDARSEALLLRDWGSSGNSGSVVLPWIRIEARSRRLKSEMGDSLSHNLPRDDAWYKGARLVVLEWTLAGRFPARGEVALR